MIRHTLLKATAASGLSLAVAAFVCSPLGSVILPFLPATAFAQTHTPGESHQPGGEQSDHEGGQGGQGGPGGQGGGGRHHGGSGKRPAEHGHRSGVHGAAEEAVSGTERGSTSGRYQGTRHVPATPEASDTAAHASQRPVSGQGLANLNVVRSLIERGDEHDDSSHDDSSHDDSSHDDSSHDDSSHDDGSHDDGGHDGDDDEAALRNSLVLYQQEMTKAAGDPVVAGKLLGTVARRPVTPEVVEKINTLLDIDADASDIQIIASTAEQQRQEGRDTHRDDRAPDTGSGRNLQEPGGSGGFQLGRGEMANRRQCDDVAGRRIKSGERISGRNLARLREINRFLWPGYSAAEGPSPIFILASFQEELEKDAPDPTVAGTYLGLVSARPLEPRTVMDIAGFLCAPIGEEQAVTIATIAEIQRQQSAGASPEKRPQP